MVPGAEAVSGWAPTAAEVGAETGGPSSGSREHPGVMGAARAAVRSWEGSGCAASQGVETDATLEKNGKCEGSPKPSAVEAEARSGCDERTSGACAFTSCLLSSRRLTQSRVVVAQLPIRYSLPDPPWVQPLERSTGWRRKQEAFSEGRNDLLLPLEGQCLKPHSTAQSRGRGATERGLEAARKPGDF